ncbi:hypothetical protein E4U21_005679, partial [Claviceps maximensis]
ANEHTISANKKTISPADVFKALDDVEFDFLKQPLEAEFAKFNQIQIEKRISYRQKAKTTKMENNNRDVDTTMADTTMADTTASSEKDAGPQSKKARTDDSGAHEDDGDVDAESDEERHVQDDDDEDDGDGQQEDEEDDEEDAEENTGAHADETQDVLQDRLSEDGDEALDEDESD